MQTFAACVGVFVVVVTWLSLVVHADYPLGRLRGNVGACN